MKLIEFFGVSVLIGSVLIGYYRLGSVPVLDIAKN